LTFKFVIENILNNQLMKNLKRLMFATALIGLFGVLQSCKSKDNTSNYQMDNQTFVNQASSSNNFEVAAGTLATTKSSNTLVQQYGARMVTEHTGVGQDLKAIATSKNLNVPTTLQEKDQTNINALNALSGAQFDAQFINMMIVSHQDAITLFQNASSANGVMDGDLRNFAANKLPSLKEHLQAAQALQTQVQGAP
jgi:putative membrane protein